MIQGPVSRESQVSSLPEPRGLRQSTMRAHIGYLSGALEHFFDGIYYPCLEATQRRPYALCVHGASDTGGAVRAVEAIATGLTWRRARPPVCVTGPPGQADLEACWELGATVAAELAE